MILKALIGLVARDPRPEPDGNQARELPQRWRDPPPRPEKPGPFRIRPA